jgi:hypothetical protein
MRCNEKAAKGDNAQGDDDDENKNNEDGPNRKRKRSAPQKRKLQSQLQVDNGANDVPQRKKVTCPKCKKKAKANKFINGLCAMCVNNVKIKCYKCCKHKGLCAYTMEEQMESKSGDRYTLRRRVCMKCNKKAAKGDNAQGHDDDENNDDENNDDKSVHEHDDDENHDDESDEDVPNRKHKRSTTQNLDKRRKLACPKCNKKTEAYKFIMGHCRRCFRHLKCSRCNIKKNIKAYPPYKYEKGIGVRIRTKVCKMCLEERRQGSRKGTKSLLASKPQVSNNEAPKQDDLSIPSSFLRTEKSVLFNAANYQPINAKNTVQIGHGIGRGKHINLPAWMTRKKVNLASVDTTSSAPSTSLLCQTKTNALLVNHPPNLNITYQGDQATSRGKHAHLPARMTRAEIIRRPAITDLRPTNASQELNYMGAPRSNDRAASQIHAFRSMGRGKSVNKPAWMTRLEKNSAISDESNKGPLMEAVGRVGEKIVYCSTKDNIKDGVEHDKHVHVPSLMPYQQGNTSLLRSAMNTNSDDMHTNNHPSNIGLKWFIDRQPIVDVSLSSNSSIGARIE